jgi:hypothetical protein
MSVRQKVTSLFETPVKAITSVAAVITALGTIIGAPLFIDGRYAHAANVKEQFTEQKQYVEQGFLIHRKLQLEDRLFELRLKDRPSRADTALIQRFEEELRAINLKLSH